jgi:hypothetical protein
VRRLLLLAALVVVAAVPSAGAQNPPRVCEGLTICSPVAGPWVIVPGPNPPLRVGSAVWELGCPNGFVGGLDARPANPWVEVTFPGNMGSPVNPGITTRQSTIFNATSVGPVGRPSSFIPFVGCIPAEGGPRTPTGVRSTAVPEQLRSPIERRVRVVEVRQKRVRAGLTCGKSRRLAGYQASAGIYSALHPTPRQLEQVHLTTELIKERIWITVTRGKLAPRLSVQVQIHALCAPRYNG